MKKMFAIVFAILFVSGCTDANISKIGALGEQATVLCYSGGVLVYEGKSTGKVESFQEDGFAFRSVETGRLVRTQMDCIAIN